MLGGIIFLILIFGLIALYSASNFESLNKFGDTYYLFKHQLIFGLLPGLILLFILARINYNQWEKYPVLFFILAIILLTLVFIPGVGATYGRAKSWVNIAGFSFQPAEIVKLLFILSLASWFAHRGKEKTSDFWNGLVPFTVILALISLPIIMQPDIGTLAVVVIIAFAIYFIAGGKIFHIISLGLVGLGAFGILIAQAPYRAQRLMTFLYPELDPEGIGYHIKQAFLAIGSGGWFGLGLGQSRQKLAYLPEVKADSIFAIIAEEMGFIVSAGLIILFLVLLFRGLKLAQAAPDDFSRYTIVGIIIWFSLQAFLNIAAMVGLLPLTGIPLPFISYGGTALMSALAATGILINISKHI
ncbi:MAG: cell division protein FtsW [Candidatus Buchananbacteria bacterium RIFCSPHIGHO2_01_FULL_39_8]|uniref:Probable peptidoglycan glycosyltransferase FtsW n=1 Tax=Candidatus Buchananbacteria bacterium RIFCSPHIGHO2_01_FULL_39_8 TaxID=1797533 RepID=A0A1G1Y0Y6_9BACT|nr:MAG: cell division protein FtsW [Candidatus Buchananbacteria bacterium RIFCSPHIGHO2_01_FULL_39_8]